MAFIDIDARRQLENEVQKRAAEFEHVNVMKNESFALLSHELRTPLSAMLGRARLLRSGKLDPDRAAHAVEIIERNTLLQARLIEDLLDVSRIIAGKLRVERRPIALRDAVAAAVEALRPAAGAKRVQLDVALGADPARVLGDSIRLQQVVGNLLSNALKFTPDAGTLGVRLGRAGAHVELEVRDTGEGIAADLLPHLFERFRQRALVEQHEGTIRAESPGPGRGATFTVLLPAPPRHGGRHRGAGAREAPCGPACARRPPSPGGRRPRRHARVRRDRLAGYGAEVTTATSVRSAVAAFERSKPQVVVSDVAMPGEHGYGLIQAVRALPPEQGGRVPALALTAYVRSEDRERVLAAGFNQHLAKPIDPIDLASAVAQLAEHI